MGPEIFVDAPMARRALRATALELPSPLHLRMAPRAVAHERHEIAATCGICALMGITLIGKAALRFYAKPRAVTPRTVMPIEF